MCAAGLGCLLSVVLLTRRAAVERKLPKKKKKSKSGCFKRKLSLLPFNAASPSRNYMNGSQSPCLPGLVQVAGEIKGVFEVEGFERGKWQATSRVDMVDEDTFHSRENRGLQFPQIRCCIAEM